MQDYDEAFFRAKANKRAGTTWLILMVIATVYYGIKVFRGELANQYFALFTAVGWSEYIISRLLLKFNAAYHEKYEWIIGLGYLTFFAVIAWTSLDESSYVFIMPLVSILILYKDPKLIKIMMWLTMFVLVSSNIYKGVAKGMIEYVSSP